MNHFDDGEWADFARNVVSAKAKMIMQEHLHNGCKRCAAALQTWQRLVAFAGTEKSFRPSEDTVRIIKSQLAAVAPGAPSGVRLVFDSALQPSALGIRGFDNGRQVLYETDEYYIDLRLEPGAEAQRSCLVGQVLNRVGAERAAVGAAICLQQGKKALAETITNRFGEFQLEFEAAPGLHIRIGSKTDAIVLPLYGAPVKSLKTSNFNDRG